MVVLCFQCKDGADDLLDAERLTLLNLKRMLEEHLKLVKEQLQVSGLVYLTV